MSGRTLGIILVVIGVLIVLAMILAAPLHLASAGFGYKKIIGLAVGAIILIIGLVMSMSRRPTV